MIIALVAATLLAGASDPEGILLTGRDDDLTILNVQAAPEPQGAPADSVRQVPHGLTTEQQIDRWLESRGDGLAPFGEPYPPELPETDRRIHGEITAGIGTHGYRSLGAAVDVPIGEAGSLSLQVQKTEGRYALPYDDPYGYGARGRFDGYSLRTGVAGRFGDETPRAED